MYSETMNREVGEVVHNEPGLEHHLTRSVLERIDYGVWLLDGQAHVLLANRSALSACRRDGPFAMDDGHLALRDHTFQRDFREALRRATLGLRNMVRVSASASANVAHCVAAVLPHVQPELVHNAQVMVLLGRRSACESLSLEMFARAQGLTAAESNLLAGLCEGLSPTQLARRQSVALCTVRTQLKSIRAKTRAANLRELIQQLSLLPPVMPLLYS